MRGQISLWSLCFSSWSGRKSIKALFLPSICYVKGWESSSLSALPLLNRAPALPALSLLYRSARPPAAGKSLISHHFPVPSQTAFGEEKPARNSAEVFSTSLAGAAPRRAGNEVSGVPCRCLRVAGRWQPGSPVCWQSQQAACCHNTPGTGHGPGDRARKRSVRSGPPGGCFGTEKVSLLWSRPVLALKAKVCRAPCGTGRLARAALPSRRHCRALLSLSPADGHRASPGTARPALGRGAGGKERGGRQVTPSDTFCTFCSGPALPCPAQTRGALMHFNGNSGGGTCEGFLN